MRDMYINSNLNPLTKFTSSSSEGLSLKISSHGTSLKWSSHEDHLNQHENSHKLSDETGHPVVNMMESQWKLRQQHDQKFQNGGKAIVEQILASEERNLSRRAGL